MRSKNINNHQIEKIEKYLPAYYREIWQLMIGTGLRVGDAVSLRWKDLDERGTVHYVAQKTGKPSKAKIPDDIYKYLAKRRGRSDNYIFPSPSVRGGHISRQAVWKNIKKACYRAGVPLDGISPHSCRKHFAVETYKAKGLGETVAKLNHNSPTTTFMYVFDEDPFEVLSKRIDELVIAVKNIRKVCDSLCDRVFGDDVYYPTQKGLDIDFDSLYENK